MEAVRLRVKDIDFKRAEITVREGKGAQGQGEYEIVALRMGFLPATENKQRIMALQGLPSASGSGNRDNHL